jgi:type VI secretion system secreted protein VgrG
MDIIVKATINGKPHGLQFHSAHISQSLFKHCEMTLELGFDDFKAESVMKDAASQWLGGILELIIMDRAISDIAKKYKGTILNMSATNSALTLFAVSEDRLLSSAKNYKSFSDMDIIGIVKDIVNSSGLNAQDIKAPNNSLKMKFFQQYDESHYDCLKRLARIDGCVFFHDGENFVYADKPNVMGNQSLKLEEVSDVSLNCNLDLTKWKGVPYDFVKHTTPSDSEYLSSPFTPPEHPYAKEAYNKSKTLFNSVTEELYNETITEKQKYESFLTKQQAFSAGNMLKVTGTTNHPMVSVGKTIDCEAQAILKNPVVVIGMDASFEGNVYSAQFEAIAEGAIIEPPLKKENLSKNVLEPAIVIDNNDPEALGRVQIQYIWDINGSAHTWSRIAQAGAGGNNGVGYGTHFTPRIGDQVLVGCENGDSSHPIILGALYHSENKPDFVTPNGSEEVLVVKTPQESTIRVIDKSGSEEIIISMKGNKNIIHLELSQPQITIESIDGTITVHSKDIKINADEKIEMKAKEIKIEASENINIKATQNIKAEAGQKAEYSGTTGLKLSSMKVESVASTENVIQGAMVKIN